MAQALEHQNIIKIIEIIETKEYAMLVSEMINGGDLFSYVLEKGYLNGKYYF